MMRNKKNYFGLGGEIGAGKSVFTDMLAQKGAYILSADKIVHELYSPGESCYRRLVRTFGKDILEQNGQIDRVKFGEIIFSSEKSRKKCNRIVHPMVFKRILNKAKEHCLCCPNQIIIFEIPLLFETKFYKKMHKNIFLTADYEVRMYRIMERNNLTEKEARMRMDSQIPQDEQIKIADYVVDNNGTLKELEDKADCVFKALMNEIL